MKVGLAEGLKILKTSYRDLAEECNMSYTSVYHLTIRKYSPQAVSRLKVEAAIAIITKYEIDRCIRKIEEAKQRMELLKKLEVIF